MSEFKKISFKSSKEVPMLKKGEALSALLGRIISSSDMTRAEAVSNMASAAGISESTVNQIVAGSIICPPADRLRGLARALPVSFSALRSAAESDGCMYE